MPDTVTFTKAERARLVQCLRALGISFGDLVHDATMQAVSEMDGLPWTPARPHRPATFYDQGKPRSELS